MAKLLKLSCRVVSGGLGRKGRKGRKGSHKGDCLKKPRRYGKSCGCKTKGGGFKFVKKSRCKRSK